jgi:hypothetical protein
MLLYSIATGKIHKVFMFSKLLFIKLENLEIESSMRLFFALMGSSLSSQFISQRIFCNSPIANTLLRLYPFKVNIGLPYYHSLKPTNLLARTKRAPIINIMTEIANGFLFSSSISKFSVPTVASVTKITDIIIANESAKVRKLLCPICPDIRPYTLEKV